MVKIEVKNDAYKLNDASANSPNSIIISKIEDPRVRAALKQLDHDNDNDIDAHEVLRLKKIEQFYKKSSIILLFISLILIGVIFAASYGAVELGKEFHAEKGASSNAAIETRRRLSAANDGDYYDNSKHLDDYSTQALFDLEGHSLKMSSINDMTVPTGSGATLLKHLVQPYLRRSDDRRRRRARRNRRRNLNGEGETSSAQYSEDASYMSSGGSHYDSDYSYDDYSSNTNNYESESEDSTYSDYSESYAPDCIMVNHVHDHPGYYTCDCVSSNDECISDGACVIEPNCSNMDGEFSGNPNPQHGNPMYDMPENMDPMDNPLASEVKQDLDLDDVYAVTCDYPFQSLAYACPHLRFAPHYTLTTPLDSLHRKIIPMGDEIVITYEGDMCGHFTWMDVVIDMVHNMEDHLELSYPTKNGYKTVDMTGRCWLELHMKSPEAVESLKEYDHHRQEEFEEFEEFYYEYYGEYPMPPGEMPPTYIYHDDTMFDHYYNMGSDYDMPWDGDYEDPFYHYHHNYDYDYDYGYQHDYDNDYDHGDYSGVYDSGAFGSSVEAFPSDSYYHYDDSYYYDSDSDSFPAHYDSYYQPEEDSYYQPEDPNGVTEDSTGN